MKRLSLLLVFAIASAAGPVWAHCGHHGKHCTDCQHSADCKCEKCAKASKDSKKKPTDSKKSSA